MRYLIEVPDARTHAVFVGLAQTVEGLVKELGSVRLENLVLGMQHELGVVAALTMEGMPENAQEIANRLLGLSGMATIYLQALVTEKTPDQEQANESSD